VAICDNYYSFITVLTLFYYFSLIKYIYFQFILANKLVWRQWGVLYRRLSLSYQSSNNRGRVKVKAKYKEIHKNRIDHYISAAAVLTGIAAVFDSTGFYQPTVNPFISIKFIHSIYSSAITQTQHQFLFSQKQDKPCFCSGYGCRSPPNSLLFRISKKKGAISVYNTKKALYRGLQKTIENIFSNGSGYEPFDLYTFYMPTKREVQR